MGRLELKSNQAKRRAYRVRSRIVGTAKKPRLTVKVSNKNITAQLIDDTTSKTISYVTTVGVKDLEKKSMTEKAEWCGKEIAKNAKSAKVKTVVLDRGAKLYHGRIATLAESARKNGLEL